MVAIVNRRRVAGTGASRRRFGVPCEHGPSAYWFESLPL